MSSAAPGFKGLLAAESLQCASPRGKERDNPQCWDVKQHILKIDVCACVFVFEC